MRLDDQQCANTNIGHDPTDFTGIYRVESSRVSRSAWSPHFPIAMGQYANDLEA